MPQKRPFVSDPALTAIAVMFKNRKLIADLVSPRIPVGKRKFAYNTWSAEQGFTIPDTKVGRRSKPNQVTFSADRENSEVEDYGLDDPIPQDDIDEAPEGVDPLGTSTEYTTGLVLLDRETRVANQVFDPNNYAAAYKQTLAGTDQFSDFANSDPIGVIKEALDSMLMRATHMGIGRLAYSKLSTHPDIVKAVHGNSGDKGVARREAIAELFELDDIYIGEAFFNTNKKGQAPSYARAWGKHISLFYQDLSARETTRQMSAFFTAQYKDRVAGATPDPDIGLRGGMEVRVGESVKEVVTSDMLAYLIQDAVA